MQGLAGQLIRYETEGLSDEETLELFAGLIASGWAWILQGRYGRIAQSLIDNHLISEDGELLVYFAD